MDELEKRGRLSGRAAGEAKGGWKWVSMGARGSAQGVAKDKKVGA